MKFSNKNIFIASAFFCFTFMANCQEDDIAALKLKLKNAKSDTTRLRLKNQIGASIPILRIGYWDSLSVEAKKFKMEKIEADAINNVGFVYNNHGDIPNALNYYEKSLKLREKIGDKDGIAESLSNIGLVYENQNDLQKAIEYFTKGLKIEEGSGDKVNIAYSLNSIGTVFYKLGNFEKALEYLKRSMKIQEELGNRNGVAVSLMNIGDVYFHGHNISESLDYYKRSLEINKSTGNKFLMSNAYNSIGVVYEIIGSKEVNAGVKQKKLQLALKYCDSALAAAKEIGFPEKIRYAEQGMYSVYVEMGKYEEALTHYKQFIIYRDSISNEQTRKASIKNQLKYEFDKKEVLLKEQQERENAVAEEINHRQKIIIWSVAIGLLLVIIFATYVWRSLKLTHQQKLVIEEKQKEILDSIHYAKRIQSALITPEKYVDKSLNRLQNSQ